MNTNFEQTNHLSSQVIDKQVKRAEIRQMYLTRVEVPHQTAKKPIWSLVRNLLSAR